jgi:phospholipid/cholesterol/gamma-HCH transport system substrate-binding protein
MAGSRTKFAIGLFVLTGLLIGAIIIIWAGASDIFLKGSSYKAYFDESVQGLQTDSAVKYRGVEIGKVEGIRVAPDHRLIEVTMKIDLSGGLEKQIFAQLRSAGITGIVFIDLDLIQPEYVIDFQTVPFETDHPIIPSRRSDANRFINDANAIIRDIRAVDFKGISDQLKASTKAVEMFLAGDRTDRIMARLEAASANLDQSMAQIRKTVDDGALKGMVQDTAETLAEGRRLINSARQEIEAMKLGEQTAKAGNILESLDQKTKAIALQLEDTAENLRVTSEYLQGIAERLNKQPSELIFSRPAPPRKPME